MSEIRLTGQLICQDDSEIVWEVSEHFRDAESFAHHQERVRTTEWDAEPPKSSEAIQ